LAGKAKHVSSGLQRVNDEIMAPNAIRITRSCEQFNKITQLNVQHSSYAYAL